MGISSHKFTETIYWEDETLLKKKKNTMQSIKTCILEI